MWLWLEGKCLCAGWGFLLVSTGSPFWNHLCLRRRPTFRIREAAQKVEGHIAELRVSVRGWSNHGNGPGNRTRKEASVRSIGTCFLSVNTKRKSAWIYSHCTCLDSHFFFYHKSKMTELNWLHLKRFPIWLNLFLLFLISFVILLVFLV